jgi:hypothetical protein
MMLDDLREQANISFFDEEEIQEPEPEAVQEAAARRRRGHFLGLTPVQRFLITFMLFMLVCLGGIAGLLVMEKIVPVLPL